MPDTSAASRRFDLARVVRAALLAIPALLMPGVAAAITSNGVDFSNPVVIDAAPATDLMLTTTEDVYIFVPNGLFFDSVTLDGLEIIITGGTTIDQNDPLLCTGSCPPDPFDLSDDVLLSILDPIGNLHVQAGGRIVVSAAAIPEPSTALLLASGLVGLAERRRARACQSAVTPRPHHRETKA